MTALDISTIYTSFYEKRGHKRIPGAPLVPENDPTTLFTSSGMQPLVPYLLGEPHPQGTRLVNVQNSFRAVDIEEVGNNRHTTFFRMLGNWSLGDYFKKEQLPWFFIFLTKELGIDPHKLYVTVFAGYNEIPKDEEAKHIWEMLFASVNIDPTDRIFTYDVKKNWWSRSGTPDKMPAGEPGGPDSEVFYDFGAEYTFHENSAFKNEKCHVNCDCGRYWEIGNSVFMQYIKQKDGSFQPLPKQNVDFGGGLERLMGAVENNPDVFQTDLFAPTIKTIEKQTGKDYQENKRFMQIIADHFGGSSFMALANIIPSNTEQGYIMRRLIRRGLDAFYSLGGKDITPVFETIAQQYTQTDPQLPKNFEKVKGVLLEEEEKYKHTLHEAKKYIEKKYSSVVPAKAGIYSDRSPIKSRITNDEFLGQKEISAEDAFILYSTHGLSPSQIESLGFLFDKQAFAQKMQEHQKLSRSAGVQKFSGGLADVQEKTVMGHTATHLLQQALRDVLGNTVHQTGSNITTERLRFDFVYDQKMTPEQMKHVEEIVNKKIVENIPVHFEMMPLAKAKTLGAIGLFDEKYQDNVKVYFMGGSGKEGDHTAYSKEFCGGPHVDFTGKVKSFKIIKQEKIGTKQQRIYATVG